VHDADVEDTSRADEVARSVRDAVQALPEDLRAPLILTAFEGFSQQEAAESLGLSVKTVEHRVARARDILRGKLG
jgi:RNA polymerase sigma-70 factor (ECF subfamily)